MDLIKKVKTSIARNRLIKAGDKVVVAVSGGPDSMTLLYLLNQLRYPLGLQLIVAHLNHGLRKNADLDQRFVQRQAQELNVPYFSTKIHNLRDKPKGSIEELARKARIDFLMKVAKKNKAQIVVLGHTQDDLVETVLMRILRGTGLAGLRSIQPKRELENTIFIRPLLNISRKEIEVFIKRNGIPYRIDPTNKDKKFFRNKIRHELLPLLEKDYNKNIRRILTSLAHSSATDYAYLEEKGNRTLKNLAQRQTKKTQILIPLDALQKLHPSLMRMILRLAIEDLKGNTRRLTFEHMREIDDLIFNRPTRSLVHLPGQIEISKNKDNITISVRKT